jgi:hypothetical protein
MNDPIAPEFDSPEEIHFSWWLEELVKAGYVRSWRRADSYELAGAVNQPYMKARVSTRTGEVMPPKLSSKSIKQAMVYTPDFEITWNEIKSLGLFRIPHSVVLMDGPPDHHFLSHSVMGDAISIVEIKPKVAGRSTMNVARFSVARMNALFLYEKHRVYANLIEVGTQPKSLFYKTFTPERFLTPDKSGKPRTIKFQPRSLSEFVAGTTKLKPHVNPII